MNNTAITVLNAVIQDTHEIAELMDISKVQCRQFNIIIQKLISDDFVIRKDTQVHL